MARYWREWEDPRLIVLVLNNGDLNFVTWEQRVMAGDPKFEDSQNLPQIDYAAYAELLGLRGIAMRAPEDVAPGWERALAADRPVVIDARVDPEVPPLPPHISFEQARSFAMSLAKGDPNGVRAVAQSLKDLASNLKGGRSRQGEQ